MNCRCNNLVFCSPIDTAQYQHIQFVLVNYQDFVEGKFFHCVMGLDYCKIFAEFVYLAVLRIWRNIQNKASKLSSPHLWSS